MNEISTSAKSCPKCGMVLPAAAAEGLCPRCLLAEAMAATRAETETAAAGKVLTPEELAPCFPQLEICECLGRGGMGVVYKARQKNLNRFVALKLLAPERVPEASFAARFAIEAQALAALNHPNIVTVYDFGQAGGFYFLLMEFVDGANLRQLLRTRKFAPEEALAIVPPLCEALQFAHEHGIVHRDIKPENILIDKAGRVRIADFGIAKMIGTPIGAAPAAGLPPEGGTQPGLGTPGYSAPEQQSAPPRADHRADIYSLGVVFYELLTGERPGQPIEPPSRKVQIDVRLDQIVLRALAQEPERRYQHASQVKTDLETLSHPALKSGPATAGNGLVPAGLGLPAAVFVLCYGCLVACLAGSLGALPERVASHFGANLEADGWMPRERFLWVLGCVPLIFPVIFLGIYAGLRSLRALAPAAAPVLRSGLWFSCLFIGFVAGIQFLTLGANHLSPPRLPAGSYLILILGFLGLSAIFVIRALLQFTRLEAPRTLTPGGASRPQSGPQSPESPDYRYRDALIEITDREIVFRRYYFPFGGDRRVLLDGIDSIEVRPPSVWLGSWRIWGGGLGIWFPLDWARPQRDAIFVAALRDGGMRIGFTVEHSREVTEILKKRGLLVPSAIG